MPKKQLIIFPLIIFSILQGMEKKVSPRFPADGRKTPLAFKAMSLELLKEILLFNISLGKSSQNNIPAIKILTRLKQLKKINKDFFQAINDMIKPTDTWGKILDALKKKNDIPIEMPGLRLFLSASKSKNIDQFLKKLSKKRISALIPAYFLAKITNHTKIQKKLCQSFIKKITTIKNGHILGTCLVLSQKYKCTKELQIQEKFMLENITFKAPKIYEFQPSD